MNKQPGIEQASRQKDIVFAVDFIWQAFNSTVLLQYVLLMLTGLKRKRSVKCSKPIYTDCMAKISIKTYSCVMVST